MAEVLCPKCGVENWLENQSRCFQCGAVLRRCADCASYDDAGSFCREWRVEIDSDEAQQPGGLAVSVNCAPFRPRLHRRAA
jgi:hypothetical protein